ncbi:hypothetical protein HanRHA438_Chr03g0101671 [Helianthus annuus]|nr:hypothetical protein HanRHA438_Chr03g0101671 [Helianthus annuus]
MFYYRINTKFVCLSSLISSIYEHNHENHGIDPETGTYNWYQSHGARFSKSNRLLSHMCSRFVIFVLFVQDVKMVKIKKIQIWTRIFRSVLKRVLGFMFFT